MKTFLVMKERYRGMKLLLMFRNGCSTRSLHKRRLSYEIDCNGSLTSQTNCIVGLKSSRAISTTTSVSTVHGDGATSQTGSASGRERNMSTRGDRAVSQIASNESSKHQCEMENLFALGVDKVSDSNFDSFAEEWLPKTNISSLSNFVRLSGKKSRAKPSPRLIFHLPNVAKQLRTLRPSSIRYRHISYLIYGLQCFTENDEGYVSILSILSERAVKILESSVDDIFSRNLSMMMLGLQKCRCERKESKQMILVLARMIDRCNERPDAQTVGNLLYGMQKKRADDPAVLTLLRAIKRLVLECKEPLSAQSVSNACYGLQSMRSDNSDVESLIHAIVSKLQGSNAQFNAREVGSALYGLKGMNSDSSAVLSLVKVLIPMIEGCKEQLSAQGVANSLYGLQLMNSDIGTVNSLIRVLVPMVTRCQETFNSQGVGSALFGLQSMTCKSPAVLSLIKALVPMVGGCRDELNDYAVGNALYGLQGLSTDNKEVPLLMSALKSLIKKCEMPFAALPVSNSLYGLKRMRGDIDVLYALAPKIASCTETFNEQHVSNALYGLQGLSHSRRQTGPLLRALIPRIKSCEVPLTSQGVGNSLYGLQCMCSSSPDVELLIRALVPLVAGCDKPLKSQEIGNALYGLQNMSTSSNDVRLMVRALVPIVENCEVPLNTLTVGCALYGLQSMSSDCDDVRALIRALIPKIETCNQTFYAQELSNALYGLQGMSSDSEDVMLLLKALEPLIVRSESSLSIQEVANALYGLQGMTETASAQSIIGFLFSQSCLSTSHDERSTRELIAFGQSISLMLPFLWGTKNYDGWEKIKLSTCHEISERQGEDNPTTRGQSAAEARIQGIAARMFEGSNVKLSCNEFLCDVFECDLVLRLAYASQECAVASHGALIINIEVDGLHHDMKKKSRFCRLRDAHLKSNGIIIMRMAVGHVETLNDADIERWLLDRLADTIATADSTTSLGAFK